jgi:hypothetical protein
LTRAAGGMKKTMNTHLRSITLLGLTALLLAAFTAPAQQQTTPPSARAAFDKLKTLAGEWRGTIGERGKGEETTVAYRLIANNSALAETLFPGTPHEMITVYHLDGDKLLVTHYCAAGNQPTLALTKKSTAEALDFDFIRATNMKSKKDDHMHSLRIRFEGANAVVTEWDGFKNGRKTETTKFFLTRKS